MKKLMLVLGLLVIASMLLSACGKATEAPAVTEPEEPVVVEEPEPTEVPASTRMGGWLDEIIFTAIPEEEQAVAQLQAGANDIDARGIANPELFATVSSDPNLKYTTASGVFNQIMVGVVDCREQASGTLNPFSNMKIREAINWMIDREYIAQELYGGLATPRYTMLDTYVPDYARYAPEVGKIIANYGYNLDRAKAVVDAEMPAMGAEMGADGKWQYKGKPVVVIGIIRTEDTRKLIGDYFANQMEKLGFTVDRQFKTRSEASPIWIGSTPEDCLWNYYTGGWISTAIDRDEGDMFAQYSTNRIQGIPMFEKYSPSPEYDVVLTKLQTNDFKDMAERDALFAQALPLSMTESWHGAWVVTESSFFPMKKDLTVASDLAAGVPGNAFWPYTMRWLGQEGGTVKVSQSGIMVEPWNPVNGSNWIDDAMPQRGTEDWAIMYDPYTGLPRPQRLESAVVDVVAGTPITKTLDWVTVNEVAEITVPGDAWVDWDATTQKFITAAEKFPEGLTAKSKITVNYPSSLWDTKWHDGSNLDMGDFVLGMIMTFDPYKPESKIFDEPYVSTLETYLSHFKGVRIVSTDPLVIETYEDLVALDAEVTVDWGDWYPEYLYGPGPWTMLTPAILGEENGEIAFSADKAGALEIERTGMLAGPSLEVQKKYLDQCVAENYIPYAPTMAEFVTADQAAARWANLAAWYEAKGHLWVGNGPYYIDQVFPVEGTLVLKHFDEFPDLASKWSSLATPKIAEAVVEGPASVKIGEAAEFDVMVTFAGEPYPAADVQSVTYLVKDATGLVALSGTAEEVAEGQYKVTLSADDTGALAAGSNMLTVTVASKVVALPTFSSIEFVTVAP